MENCLQCRPDIYPFRVRQPALTISLMSLSLGAPAWIQKVIGSLTKSKNSCHPTWSAMGGEIHFHTATFVAVIVPYMVLTVAV